jgi:hypothetical protein
MTDNNKTFKVDMDFDELVERVAQTDGNEFIQISQEKMNDTLLMSLLKNLKQNHIETKTVLNFGTREICKKFLSMLLGINFNPH